MSECDKQSKKSHFWSLPGGSREASSLGRECKNGTSEVLNTLEGAEKKGRKGDRRPEVLRYSYDSRGASFCVKNTAFLVWRLFLLKHIKGPHEGFRNFTIFYIKIRSRIAKLLN